MTLLALLQKNPKILRSHHLKDNGTRDSLLHWLADAIEKVIQQQGAFFRRYEFNLVDAYWLTQTGAPFSEHTWIYKNHHIEAKRFSRSPIVNALRRFHTFSVFSPEGARHADVWYKETGGLERYLRKITTKTTERGLPAVRLVEPYFSAFQHCTSTFRQPLSNHVMSGGDV